MVSPTMRPGIRAEPDPATRRTIQETITAQLPEWFGRPDSNRHYASQAENLPGWVASIEGRDVGLLLLKRHGPLTAEIYWMGVEPGHHRHGVGRALLDAVCAALAGEGRKLLFAYSLHPDHPNEHYRRTRLFYERLGFFLAVPNHGDPDDPMAWYVKVLAA
jgi:GNAT superfamily N-acetyltransferase